jgi:hypothetical protein
VGAPPYGRRVVQRVVLVNVAELIEFPGAFLKGSRPPKLGSEPNLSNGLSSRLRRSPASIAHAPQRLGASRRGLRSNPGARYSKSQSRPRRRTLDQVR